MCCAARGASSKEIQLSAQEPPGHLSDPECGAGKNTGRCEGERLGRLLGGAAHARDAGLISTGLAAQMNFGSRKTAEDKHFIAGAKPEPLASVLYIPCQRAFGFLLVLTCARCWEERKPQA